MLSNEERYSSSIKEFRVLGRYASGSPLCCGVTSPPGKQSDCFAVVPWNAILAITIESGDK